VTATTEPRLKGGFLVSVILHGAVVAAFILATAPRAPSPSPPLYHVELLAAPAAPSAVGVIQPPTPAPVAPTPVPTSKAPPKVKPATTAKTKPTPTPKVATPVPQPKTATPPKIEEPQPTAGGGAIGGKGSDVKPLDTPGIEFPYPGYLQNVAREIIGRFQAQPTRATLVAEIRFMIKRDGTVDPESIGWVTRSGNYPFDQKAMGAVEAAANANRFGPLPAGFREDILPVIFRFTPALR
jgi:outer membrane biosynthesis protein TonB